jgi:hypothetical protein
MITAAKKTIKKPVQGESFVFDDSSGAKLFEFDSAIMVSLLSLSIPVRHREAEGEAGRMKRTGSELSREYCYDNPSTCAAMKLPDESLPSDCRGIAGNWPERQVRPVLKAPAPAALCVK